MAMNKKEKQHIEDLKEIIEMRDTLLALRHTNRVLPDIDIPTGNNLVNGYSFNAHRIEAHESCSSSVSHGSIHGKTSTQRPIEQYSTLVLALKALRHEMELLYSKKLRSVDLMIDRANQ